MQVSSLSLLKSPSQSGPKHITVMNVTIENRNSRENDVQVSPSAAESRTEN